MLENNGELIPFSMTRKTFQHFFCWNCAACIARSGNKMMKKKECWDFFLEKHESFLSANSLRAMHNHTQGFKSMNRLLNVE